MLLKPRRTQLTLFLALLMCFALVEVKPIFGQRQVKITGTFSNMHFIKEAGDVLGYEIKIVYAGGSYQSTLQFAEGAPSELLVFKKHKKGKKINFFNPA